MNTVTSVEVALRRVWKALALRGLVSIAFGVVLLAWPDISLEALVLAFGAFVAAHGVLGIAAAVRARLRLRERFWLLLQGATSVGFGIVAFARTDMTELALLYLVGAWAIAVGLVGVAAGLGLPVRRSSKLLLVLEGLAAIAFGVVMFASPSTGALALVALIAALALVVGVTMIAFAFELRGLGRDIDRRATSIEPVPQS